jgi:hypothetical protein
MSYSSTVIWKPEITGRKSSYFLVAVNMAALATIQVPLMGCSLYKSSGAIGAISLSVLCCLVLYFSAYCLAKQAIHRNVGTMKLLELFFGRKGAFLCALASGLAFFSWFVWQLHFCASTLRYFFSNGGAFPDIQLGMLGFFLGVFIFCVAFLQYHLSLQITIFILVPSLLLSLGAFFSFFPAEGISRSINLTFTTFSFYSFSTSLSSLSAHILITPTFFRFAFSLDKAKRSLQLIYLLLLPLFFFVGIAIGIFSPQQDAFGLVQAAGAWRVWAAIYIVLGTLTVCFLNIYYGADSIAHAFHLQENSHVIFLTAIGTLSCFLFWNHLAISVETLGVFIVSIVFILLNNLILDKNDFTPPSNKAQLINYYSLILCYCVGFLEAFDFIRFSGSPFLDMAVVASVSRLFLSKIPASFEAK